ncbi:hypothetical protein [Tenggerimyces flavus]|uniref:Uncharacterized protein n=1 Tax=Tenggerimyces flavus TaxID=1708749 RepID=A0ABV7YA87_9ACTN|nr:hypothetical protein [Tenggerimyces flavus]MBM7785507.1 hypothetical protein [Tenggerimyces flavus]
MARWQRGEAAIEQLLANGELQTVSGSAADGDPWLTKARRTLSTATVVADSDPESAWTLAYDAARFACTALLAQQGVTRQLAAGILPSMRPFGTSSADSSSDSADVPPGLTAQPG